MSETEFVLLYSTFPDAESAQTCARRLVEARLAACANILAPMQSVYQWHGKIETSDEIGVLFKTRRALFGDAAKALRQNHPYELPCVLMLPIVGGGADYLDWLRRQTGAAASNA